MALWLVAGRTSRSCQCAAPRHCPVQPLNRMPASASWSRRYADTILKKYSSTIATIMTGMYFSSVVTSFIRCKVVSDVAIFP